MRTIPWLLALCAACETEKLLCDEGEYRALDGSCVADEGGDDDEPSGDDSGWADDTAWVEEPSEDDTAEPVEEVEVPTSDVPIDPVTALEGAVYQLRLAEADWLQPAGVGDVLTGYLDGDLLLGISDVSDEGLALLVGRLDDQDRDGDGEEIEQDPCRATVDWAVARFDNPNLATEAGALPLVVDGLDAPLTEAVLQGYFSDEGESMELLIEAELDTRPLASLVDDSPDAFCDLVEELDMGGCQPCSTDGEDFCLPVQIAEVPVWLAETGLSPLAEEDVPAWCVE